MKQSTKLFTILCSLCAIDTVLSGVAPAIPNNGRAEFYLRKNDGAYSYGYDTGVGSYATQTGSSNNEVEGKYTYNDNGRSVVVKYTAGVDGYKPETEGLAKFVEESPSVNNAYLPPKESYVVKKVETKNVWSDSNQGNANSDGSYKFEYNTGDISHHESADRGGNVRGSYSYTNDAGRHDLSYEAGAEKGFVVTGGSLATANGLSDAFNSRSGSVQKSWSGNHGASVGHSAVHVKSVESPNNDGSYSFNYNTGDSARQESADRVGNVRGSYSYTNEAGNHDLSYEAGAEKGFVVTGGSLATANGLSDDFNTRSAAKWSSGAAQKSWSGNQGASVGHSAVHVKSFDGPSNNDGSYKFEYNTGDISHQESADRVGNVRGSYSYTNDAGRHDLSYEAGADKGFVVTGGSLATANGLSDDFNTRSAAKWSSGPAQKSWSSSENHGASVVTVAQPAYHAKTIETPNTDGSYNFEYNTGDSARQESADRVGNVRGSYSYTNEAGNHDLSYEAGAEKGFVVTGGSLATANGLSDDFNTRSAAKWSSGAAQKSWSGNQGSSVGHSAVHVKSFDGPSNNDGSYSFDYNTGDSARQESADRVGNVRGSYSYTNEAGNHDLSYEAGAEKGFVVTGGSLATANGLSDEFNTRSAQKWKSASTQNSWSGNQGASVGHSAVLVKSQDNPTNKFESYTIEYDTGDHSRKESGNAGIVRGRYSYKDEAGNHDLSYEAGPETGFVVTGGSLAQPNGLKDGLKTLVTKTVVSQPLTKSHVQQSQWASHTATTSLHGSPSSSSEHIAGRNVQLKTGSGPIGTKWLPVPANYKSGYYFEQH